MINWESSADRGRGRRPPTRGRGQRSAQYTATKLPLPREKTPNKEAAPAPAPAPRGSPIARKLARHSSPWTNLTVPQMAVQVRSRPPTFPNASAPVLPKRQSHRWTANHAAPDTAHEAPPDLPSYDLAGHPARRAASATSANTHGSPHAPLTNIPTDIYHPRQSTPPGGTLWRNSHRT